MENVNADRYRGDFELWAAECVKIVDKESGREVPFRLNAPQRRVLGVLEDMRRSRRPVRVIMLKARQWGGSTLIQVYMAWLQLVVCRGWNSLTCAHVKDAAAAIRGMYTRLLRSYPDGLKTGSARDWQLAPYEKSSSTGYVAARDCQVAIATSMAPNSVRGSNFALAHLSEVAFWGDGDEEVAQEIVRTVSGTVLRCPDSLIVMESTANGCDNYFYREWQRAVAGKSDKVPVFVPWHEIELYSRPVEKAEAGRLLAALDGYERDLLAKGVPLESVAWYHDKRKEYQSHEAMMAEFPTTAEEAFASSADAVFSPALVPPGGADAGMPVMAVVVPPSPGRDLLLLPVAVEDGVVVFGEEVCPCKGHDIDADELARECLRSGVEVMVVECAEERRFRAPWCARGLLERGVPVLYDSNDNPWFAPDAVTLSQWVDSLTEMLREGRVKECAAGVTREYGSFRYENPGRTPAMLARLAAAFYCRNCLVSDDYSSLL